MSSRGMSISKALEESIKAYSRYLLELPKHKTADELEFLEKEMHRQLDDQSRDVYRREIQVVQLLQFLCEAHGKSAIVSLGINPYTMLPIIREDGDEMMF